MKLDQNTTLILNGAFNEINANNFDDIALSLFHFQYTNNTLYKNFADSLDRPPGNVKNICDIPFLPVSFFKTHKVISGDTAQAGLIFESSGTTGETPSRHYVKDPALYRKSLLNGFETFYGKPGDYVILALLPSYLERKNASLVYMAKTLMEQSGRPECGFYLDEWEQLNKLIRMLESRKQKTLLLGVTFALTDFAEAYPVKLEHTLVMETGGMKGRKQEWTRHQVHDHLKKHWQLEHIHSEYGMTEMLSQAYSRAEGLFSCTPSMKVLCRDLNDPLEVRHSGSGYLNIIDLANIHSCSFIATDDMGNIGDDGRFQVLGRMDHSALRGCSLMAV